MTKSGRQFVQQLATVLPWMAMRCLLVTISLTATGMMPCVSRIEINETESPVETDGESLELALPGCAEHESRRRPHNIEAMRYRRERCKLANARFNRRNAVAGHRLANGHCAPLRC